MDFYPHPSPGFLRISGEHRLDFLQRQTSNDLRPLASGRAIQTVLTSAMGRILDIFTLLDEGQTLGVITLAGRAAASARFLQSRIFFMDRVAVADASAEWFQVDICEAALLQRLAVKAPLSGQVLENRWGKVVGNGGLTEAGTRLLVPAAAGKNLLPELTTIGGVALTPEEYAIIRVEFGHPSPAVELTEAYTPLEVGLQSLVADNKGCFTGQEVLARQVNYDKITRHLAGISLEAAVPLQSAVIVEGKSAGEITSSVISPRFGPIALAVLRRPYHQPGTAVMAGDVAGRVVSLPFGT